jgi:hypothetical protein
MNASARRPPSRSSAVPSSGPFTGRLCILSTDRLAGGLYANMSETALPPSLVSRASEDLTDMTASAIAPLGEETEVAQRRQFTVEFKRRIVKEADAYKGGGEVGALLRREGPPQGGPVRQKQVARGDHDG